MEQNEDGFWVLAKTSEPVVDAVTRYSRTHKMEFPSWAFIEFRITDKYGPQLILGAFGAEGKWPVNIETPYTIERPRHEIPIPSAHVLPFLVELKHNIDDAIKLTKTWERQRGLR